MKEAPPDFLVKVERFFEAASTAYVNQQIAQAHVGVSEAQSIERWLSRPTHEHEIGEAVDVLGIVSFAMLFVPGFGEAEMGFFGTLRAAYEAQKYLKAAGLFTAAMGFLGSISGGASDSIYLYKRFGGGPDAAARAARWDGSDRDQLLSTASVILSLPDLPVGTILLARDLPEIAEDAAKASVKAGSYADRSSSLSGRAARLETKAAQSSDAAMLPRIGTVTQYAHARAKMLTDLSIEMNKDAVQLNRKLYLRMLVNGSATLAGSPMMDGYFAHDARRAYSINRPGPERWIGQYLSAPHRNGGGGYRGTRSFSFHIGTTRRAATK